MISAMPFSLEISRTSQCFQRTSEISRTAQEPTLLRTEGQELVITVIADMVHMIAEAPVQSQGPTFRKERVPRVPWTLRHVWETSW